MGLLLFVAWLVMACVGGLMLEPHGRTGQGFCWAFFFGPVGLIATVIIRANLDREKSDKETRELLRQEIATRDQMVERAVIAALAVHNVGGDARTVVKPADPTPQPAPAPAARSYDEIMASEPQRPPRRFR